MSLEYPLASDMNVLRPSLLPGLLDSLRNNLTRQNQNVRLFEVGRNFAAGMSGGIAYVLNRHKTFEINCNLGLVDLLPVEGKEDIITLKNLIKEHFQYTRSSVAENILVDWETTLPFFVKVYPRDYRRVIEERKRKEQEILVEVNI